MTSSGISANAIAAGIGGSKGMLECAGNPIYYEIVGKGLPLVLIHDGLIHRVAFNGQIDAFQDKYMLIRYDRPGYGDSPPAITSLSHVLTLEHLLEQLGIGECILLGGSAGGGIALDFTLSHPEEVRALILVGAALSGYEFTDHMMYRGWRNSWGESEEEIIEFWCKDPWLIDKENVEAKEAFRNTLLSHRNNIMHEPVELLDDYRVIDRLFEIKIPTMIVIGESDIADNHAVAGILQNKIRNAQRKIVTHSGHLVYLEQADQFNELVLGFLADIDEF